MPKDIHSNTFELREKPVTVHFFFTSALGPKQFTENNMYVSKKDYDAAVADMRDWHRAYNDEINKLNMLIAKIQKIVPEPQRMYYCFRCQEHIVPSHEEICESCGSYVGGDFLDSLQELLYGGSKE